MNNRSRLFSTKDLDDDSDASQVVDGIPAKLFFFLYSTVVNGNSATVVQTAVAEAGVSLVLISPHFIVIYLFFYSSCFSFHVRLFVVLKNTLSLGGSVRDIVSQTHRIYTGMSSMKRKRKEGRKKNPKIHAK